MTLYERQLAEALVDLEWDAVRYRNLRAELIRAETRDRAANTIETSTSPYSIGPSKQSRALASNLFAINVADKEAAAAALEKTGSNLEEIVARAYAKEITTLSHIERQMADIETRRRRLLDDYERLKSRRSQNIPDAEIVETDGD